MDTAVERKICLTDRVYLEALDSYDEAELERTVFPLFEKVCEDNGFGEGFFQGKKVAVKPNLLSKSSVDKCVTTHPSFTYAACKYFTSLGAQVVVCDSPGGVYNKGTFAGIVKETGTQEAAEKGGGLVNSDFGFRLMSDHNYSKFSFNIINPLADADVIVNLARLKTHALCEMTAAVKNMFGAIPGLQKAEQHARFPKKDDFANMLCDLCLITAPCINIVDAVICMEGNGPSGGTLRKVGAVLASANPFALDYVASSIMGYGKDEVGTVRASIQRKLCPDSLEGINIMGNSLSEFACKFKRPDSNAGGIVKQIT